MPSLLSAENESEECYRSGEFGLVGAEQVDETYMDNRRSSHRVTAEGDAILNGQTLDVERRMIEFPEDKLYGRDDELKTLLEVYQRNTGPQVVFISGYAGSGKTRLVEEAVKQLGLKLQENPIFMYGKYEEFRIGGDLYKGLSEAIGRWYKSLSATAKTEVIGLLEDEVGDDVTLLEEIVPSLSKDNTSSAGGSSRTSSNALLLAQEVVNVSTLNRSRVFFALTCFVKAISASLGHSPQKFVLFLDDLQWAEEESIKVLQGILCDLKLPNFVFVGSYRSNEVHEDHSLTELVDELDMWDLPITNIHLQDLNRKQLNSFVADTLNLHADKVQPLTEAVFSKTLGNILFARQALEQLARKNALYYSLMTFQWCWVDEQLANDASLLSNDVVAMIQSKIEEDLSPKLHKILVVAAHLSPHLFDCQILAAATNTDIYGPRLTNLEEIQTLLEEAVNEGLLRCCSTSRKATKNEANNNMQKNEYTFFHDRTREAAGSLVVGQIRERLLFHVGKVLAEQIFEDKDEEVEDWMLFTAAHHLNSPISQDHSNRNPDWTWTMVKLNLETAKASMATAAFNNAATYSEQGIGFLPSSNWRTIDNDNNRELCFELYATAAEAFRLDGDIEKMEEYSNAILDNQSATQDDENKLFKVRYNLAVGLFYGAERHEESLAIMLDLLSQLNCRFPKSTVICISKTVGNLASLPFAKKKRTKKELEAVEFMESPEKFKCMMIMDKLFELCYLMKKEDLLPLVIFRAHEYTIKHGLCIYSSKLFAAISLFYSEVLNDLKGAAVYATYALELMKKVNHRPIECGTLMIAYFFGLHWTLPVRDCIEPMRRAYTIGTKTGELENPMWCIFNVFLFSFQAGVSLNTIEAAIVQYLPEMEAKSLKMIVYCTKSFLKLTRTLLGRPMDDETETDEVMSEVPVAKLIGAAGARIKQGYFGDFESCAESGIRAGSDVRKASPGGPVPVMDMCVCALSCYVVAQRTGQARYLKEAKGIHKTFKGWVKQGNPNLAHWLLLLDAESAALRRGRKKKQEVVDKYESAVSVAKEGGYYHDAAIGYERLGEYLLQHSEEQEAGVKLKQSLGLWREWGAVGKAERMIEKYSSTLEEKKEEGVTE